MPCVDVSLMGDRALMEGHYTSLFYDAMAAVKGRIVDGAPLEVLLIENVEGLLARTRGARADEGEGDDEDEGGGGGEGMKEAAVESILSTLERLGYDAAWRLLRNELLPGADGESPAPVARPRVLIVAVHRSTLINPADLLLAEDFTCCGLCAPPCGICFTYAGLPRTNDMAGVWRNAKMPFLLEMGVSVDMSGHWSLPRLGMLGCFTRSNSRQLVLLSDTQFGLLPLCDAVRLYGMDPSWFDCLRKRPHPGSPLAHCKSQIHAFLGDAVTVPLFSWVGERIRRRRTLAGAFDMRLATPFSGAAPPPRATWPRAGLSLGGCRFAVAVGPTPKYAAFTPLGSWLTRVEAEPLDAGAVAASLAAMQRSKAAKKLAGPILNILHWIAGFAAPPPAGASEQPVRRSGRGAASPRAIWAFSSPLLHSALTLSGAQG